MRALYIFDGAARDKRDARGQCEGVEFNDEIQFGKVDGDFRCGRIAYILQLNNGFTNK